MKSIEIKAEKRTDLGKKATKKLRVEKKVPCVLYGGGENPIHFTALVPEFKPLVYTPNSYIVNLTIGEDKYTAALKALQFHPVSDEIQHLDFLLVTEDKPVCIPVPVKLTGFAKGVKEGGKLKQDTRKITVKGLLKDLPDFVEVAIDDLGVAQTLSVKNLAFENLEIIEPKTKIIASVISTRASKAATEEQGKK